MLIEFVRERPCLYNMSIKKYSDYAYKETIWAEIAVVLKQQGMSNTLLKIFYNPIQNMVHS